jgi:hypothetical protein
MTSVLDDMTSVLDDMTSVHKFPPSLSHSRCISVHLAATVARILPRIRTDQPLLAPSREELRS